MRKLVQWLITRIKGESYNLPQDLGFKELFPIMINRGRQVIRGGFLKLRIKSKGIVFCGKHVTIRHANKVYAEKGLIVQDNVYIDAFSRLGVNIGRNVTIGRNTVIECTGVIRNPGEGLYLEDRVALGAFNYIGVRGTIRMGKIQLLDHMSVSMLKTIFLTTATYLFDCRENRARESLSGKTVGLVRKLQF